MAIAQIHCSRQFDETEYGFVKLHISARRERRDARPDDAGFRIDANADRRYDPLKRGRAGRAGLKFVNYCRIPPDKHCGAFERHHAAQLPSTAAAAQPTADAMATSASPRAEGAEHPAHRHNTTISILEFRIQEQTAGVHPIQFHAALGRELRRLRTSQRRPQRHAVRLRGVHQGGAAGPQVAAEAGHGRRRRGGGLPV
jgi:hypothetical protein